MMILISGGAASGKSEYAEQIACRIPARERVYLATMESDRKENQTRIVRHRALRNGKGFRTVECSAGIQKLSFLSETVVLLECLGNLLANEMFSETGAGKENAEETVKRGINALLYQGCRLIVVSNDVFSDGISYGEETRNYQTVLGRLNIWIAKQADLVTEVVCGIPVQHKKGKENENLGIV